VRVTELAEFQRQLRETGSYHTDDAHRASRRAKPSALLTARFSLSVTRIFPLCALYQALNILTPAHWAQFCFPAVTMPEKCGMNVLIDGWAERAAYKGPVVYVCNHMSTLETILLPPTLMAFGPFRVVTKASLAHLPLLGKAAITMGIVPLGRTNPKADLLALFEAGKRCLVRSEELGVRSEEAGASMLIFPQGTRTPVFSRSKFSSIGAKLAEKSGVPIVPIAVDTRCMPLREKGIFKKAFRDFGPIDTSLDIRLKAGPLIMPSAGRAMHEQSFNWIASQLKEWNLPVET